MHLKNCIWLFVEIRKFIVYALASNKQLSMKKLTLDESEQNDYYGKHFNWNKCYFESLNWGLEFPLKCHFVKLILHLYGFMFSFPVATTIILVIVRFRHVCAIEIPENILVNMHFYEIFHINHSHFDSILWQRAFICWIFVGNQLLYVALNCPFQL